MEFQVAGTGGHTVRGGQVPAVLAGGAELTVGGPMVTMKMLEDGEDRLVSFCAVAAGNPWILAGPAGAPTVELEDLAGKTIVDVANVGTATMTFLWLLAKVGIELSSVTLVPGSGDEAADVASVAAGTYDFALHSLHALAPYIVSGRLSISAELAGPTGAVPWSAYIARPERIAAMRSEFVAFVRAIARAQAFMAMEPAIFTAKLVSEAYPGYPLDGLVAGFDGYHASGVLAPSPAISRADFERFSALLVDVGWLQRAASFDILVDNSLADAAVHVLSKRERKA
ncbi:NitT/TauT family transport system substrate-binding protein [Aureimonas pseudogalii]|uniref:NitT/TauT family transport system substrate-binding protein n=1 Tax=Aureimonas pseudogalii TaxID=1744844 RepID=A0A7W6H5T3_9HYPH|nr:NitT/TauT family transport system substrate-binding protein [Aureimonas pseudogalii]